MLVWGGLLVTRPLTCVWPPAGWGEPRSWKREAQRVPRLGRAFRSSCLFQEAWALGMSRGRAFLFFFQEIGLWTGERLLCLGQRSGGLRGVRLEDPAHFSVRHRDPPVWSRGNALEPPRLLFPAAGRPGASPSQAPETLSERMKGFSCFELPSLSPWRGYNTARLAGLPGGGGAGRD